MAITDLKTVGEWKPGAKSKRWQVDWLADDAAKGKVRRRKRFSTKAEAEDFQASTRQAIRAGSWVDPKLADKMTVGKLALEWLERVKSVGANGRRPVTPKTYDNYIRLYENYIEPQWGMTRVSGVTYDATSEWITSLKGMNGEPAGARTRELVSKVFGRIMGFAVRKRLLPANPAKDPTGRADYIPDARPVKRHTYLTMEQLATIAREAGDGALMVMLAGTCGLRWGEVTALTVANVRLGNRPMLAVTQAYSEVSGKLILGPTKGGEDRQVPIPRRIADRLRDAVEGAPSTARVFQSPRGTVLRNGNFTKNVYKPAIERAAAGDPDFPSPTFHDLRHTAVSLAISVGSNVKVVQRIAGHASATLTLDTYAGLFDDDLHDSASRLNDLLQGIDWQ
ncbi:tyrosine-type recombinase/integrase [Pseudarthrobacter sp. MDT1-22]